MKQLQFAGIAGGYPGIHFAVSGDGAGEVPAWQFMPGACGASVHVCAATAFMEPMFFCTVKEAVSSLCVLAGTVLPESFRITVSGMIRRIVRRTGRVFQYRFREFRFRRQELYRQRGGLRL